MSPVKIIFVVFFSTFFLVLGVDLTRFYVAYDAIAKALAQSVDAGLIAGTDDDTRSLGKLEVDLVSAKVAATDILRKNLKLDSGLENDNFKNSSLQIQIVYTNDVPRLEGVFSTHLNLYAGKLFGLSEFPLRIPKRTPYINTYR